MWSAERPWQIALAPQGATLLRRSWRGAVLHTEHLPCSPSHAPAAAQDAPWHDAVQALGEGLARQPRTKLTPRAVRVVLSGHFVRWQLLPWRDALVHPRELAAYAGLRFREVFGTPAAQWQVAYAATAPGHAVAACAIDTALVAALRARCAAAGTRLVAVTPYASLAFGRWRRTVGQQPAFFGVLEPGHVALGLLEGGHWRSLRSARLPLEAPRLGDALRRLLLQEGLVAGCDAGTVPLYLAGAREAPAAMEDLAFSWLRPRGVALPASTRMALGV